MFDSENLSRFSRIALTISSGIVRLWIDSVFTQHGEKLKEWRTAFTKGLPRASTYVSATLLIGVP